MKFRDYTIISANLVEDLILLVQGRMQCGWVPIGGVAVSAGEKFHQAMGMPL